MSYVILSTIEGNTAVTTPIEDKLPNETDDIYLHRIARKANLTNYHFIKRENIKGHNSFSDAWVSDGEFVTTDMRKARIMRMNQIRQVRNARLAALDKDMMIAQEKGEQSKIEALKKEKQRLREIPQKYDLMNCSNELELLNFDPVYKPEM